MLYGCGREDMLAKASHATREARRSAHSRTARISRNLLLQCNRPASPLSLIPANIRCADISWRPQAPGTSSAYTRLATGVLLRTTGRRHALVFANLELLGWRQLGSWPCWAAPPIDANSRKKSTPEDPNRNPRRQRPFLAEDPDNPLIWVCLGDLL